MQINSLLHHVFTQKKWQVQWNFHHIFQTWPKIAGHDVAAHAQPAIIRKNTLWIQVDNSAWMHHLQLLKPDLLQRINAALDDKQLSDLRFVMGQPVIAEKKESNSLPEPHQPASETIENFKQMTSCLEDKESRRALRKLWLRFQQNA